MKVRRSVNGRRNGLLALCVQKYAPVIWRVVDDPTNILGAVRDHHVAVIAAAGGVTRADASNDVAFQNIEAHVCNSHVVSTEGWILTRLRRRRPRLRGRR